jgi:hypothetical protein
MNKLHLLWMVVWCVSGCGDGESLPCPRRSAYPPLNASPPPPPPPLKPAENRVAPVNRLPVPDTGVTAVSEDQIRYRKRMDLTEQIERLRQYSAKATPGDPFALTEKEIMDMEQQGEPGIL